MGRGKILQPFSEDFEANRVALHEGLQVEKQLLVSAIDNSDAWTLDQMVASSLE